MEIERALQFLRENHRGVMLTWRRDGSPQLSPVTQAVGADGRVVVSTRETAMKAKNLARDPRTAICAMNDGFFGEWLQVTGTAEVVPMPDALRLLEDYYRQVSGEHPDWDDYRAAMVRDRRVAVCITVERAGPDTAG